MKNWTKQQWLNGEVAIHDGDTTKMAEIMKGVRNPHGFGSHGGTGIYYYVDDIGNLNAALPKNPNSLLLVKFADLVEETEDYKGDLAGFPKEVVEKMLERQAQAGNPRDVTVFEKMADSGSDTKGFSWGETIEKGSFWANVIAKRNFDLFFEKYPKQPIYTKEYFEKNKVAIQSNTKEEADAVMKKLGIRSHWGPLWITIGYKPDISLWDSGITYWGNHDYTIIQASEVLKQQTQSTMEKKLIGYKLVKQKYEQAALKIGRLKYFIKGSDGTDIGTNSDFTEKLREAGVLDLWFDPVYEKEYKIDDYVYIENAGDGAHKVGDIGKIISMDGDDVFKISLVNKTLSNHYNTSIFYCRKATPEEIAAVSVKTLSVGGKFDLTIKDGKAFHKSEDITAFVTQLVEHYQKTDFAGYPIELNLVNIVFSRTGCQRHNTSLQDWIKVYNMIKS